MTATKNAIVSLVVFAVACGGQPAVGDNIDAAAFADAEICDLGLTQGWHALPALPGGARQETAVVALNGEVYVIGGFTASIAIVSDVEVYNPCTESWRVAAPLPRPLHHVNAAVVAGRLYVVGSMTDNFAPVGEVWQYDPATDLWTPKVRMLTARGASAVGVIDDKIYVAGGNASVTDFSVYDTSRDSWQVLTPLPDALDHVVGASVDGIFYAIGGRSGGIEMIRGTVYAFDPSVGSWTVLAPMLTARGGSSAAVVASKVYVFGGEGNTGDPSGVFPQTEVYDPMNNTWAAADPMMTPRHGTGAASVMGVIFVPGGADQQFFGAVATHEAYLP